jgi:hypothetical protein
VARPAKGAPLTERTARRLLQVLPVRYHQSMQQRRLPLVALLTAFAVPANALTFTLNRPIPFVYIQVGQGGRVETVEFDLGTTEAGGGTPIPGIPSVPIRYIGRNTFRGGSSYIVTIDSSAGLINDNGDTIPFSEFSWTTSDGEFSDGTFNDSSNQVLHEYTGAYLGFEDTMTFSYANDSVYPGGTYAGRVTFTISQL